MGRISVRELFSTTSLWPVRPTTNRVDEAPRPPGRSALTRASDPQAGYFGSVGAGDNPKSKFPPARANHPPPTNEFFHQRGASHTRIGDVLVGRSKDGPVAAGMSPRLAGGKQMTPDSKEKARKKETANSPFSRRHQ